MAETSVNVNLRGGATGLTGVEATPLQIRIFSTGTTGQAQVPTYPDSTTGVISFDMNSQRVGINGMWFGTSQNDYNAITTKVNAMLDALDENGLVTITGTDNAPIYTTTNIIGVGNDGKITIGTGDTAITGTSVTGVIADVKSALETTITTITNNMQGTTGDGATGDGKHVEVKVTVGACGPQVIVNENDIASANELDKVKGVADTAVQSVNNHSGTGITLTGTDIKVGGTGTYGNSGIDVAIQDLADKYANIDKDSFVNEGTLVYFTADSYGDPAVAVEGRHTTDYTNNEYRTAKDSTYTKPYIKLVIVQSTGTSNGQTSGTSTEAYIYINATSLVDVYTVPQTQSGPVTLSINDHTITAAFNIDEASQTGRVTTGAAAPVENVTIESYVKVSDSVTVTTEDGSVTAVSVGTKSVDAAGAAKKAYLDALGQSGDAASENTIYGAKKAAAEAAAEAAKHTTVTGIASDYITITGTGTTGGTQYTIQTTGIDDAISTAASNAETNAKNYADTIISWTVY